MAIAWVLRDKRVTSALSGARNVEQLDNSLDAVRKLQFTNAELSEIDRYAQEGAMIFGKEGSEPDRAKCASTSLSADIGLSNISNSQHGAH
jgi:hypothetical protein